MKILKNVHEIRRSAWKTIEKRKLKENWSVLNICWNFEKNCHFWENLM